MSIPSHSSNSPGDPSLIGKVWRFSKKVAWDFFIQNKGFILSGAVAYNVLLSLIPLLAVIVIALSHFMDEQRLLDALSAEMVLVAPVLGPALVDAVEGFLMAREAIGLLLFLGLLFFSSFAFRVLEEAIALIFERPVLKLRRSFWVRALLPYLFVCLIGVGVLGITLLTAALDALAASPANAIFGPGFVLERLTNLVVYLAGVAGLALLFTTLYVVLPVTSISFRRALFGGVTAAVLWEIVRYLMVLYFTQISIVNLVYGSLAMVIVFLLSIEAAAIIVLLGAQVIAELEKNAHLKVPWWERADEPHGWES